MRSTVARNGQVGRTATDAPPLAEMKAARWNRTRLYIKSLSCGARQRWNLRGRAIGLCQKACGHRSPAGPPQEGQSPEKGQIDTAKVYQSDELRMS